MEIVRAEKMGFCFGVGEAVKLSEDLASREENRRIFMLGMLVHNEYVIGGLKAQGVEILEEETLMKDEDELREGDIVIVRAHGAEKRIYDKLLQRKVAIYDAACSFVTGIRKTLVEMEDDNYEILFIGDKDHPEVKGIISFGKKVMVFKNLDELKNSDLKKDGKYALLTQTTLNKNLFNDIKEYTEKNFTNIKIFNKICGATYERQKAIEKLSKEVDVVLVVGGEKSSNTKKLYDISKKINSKTYLVQGADNLEMDWFQGVKRIGVTAGASTPEEIIIKIENKLRGIIDV